MCILKSKIKKINYCLIPFFLKAYFRVLKACFSIRFVKYRVRFPRMTTACLSGVLNPNRNVVSISLELSAFIDS